MTPEQLFELHRPKALRVAGRLCWHYQISGAMTLQEDAAAEASMGLWKECCRFQPRKQAFARAADRRQISDVYWSIVRKQDLTPRIASDDHDPYRTFWMFASTRVHGAVIDFFRAQKIIQRLPRGIEGLPVYCERCGGVMEDRGLNQECEYAGFCRAPASMLHHERFLSASREYGQEEGGAEMSNTFFDVFSSRECADERERCGLAHDAVLARAKAAGLTGPEFQTVALMCRLDADRSAVARHMDKTPAWVHKTLLAAGAKMLSPRIRRLAVLPLPQAAVEVPVLAQVGQTA